MNIKKASQVNYKDLAYIEFNSGYIWSDYSLQEEEKLAKEHIGQADIFIAYEKENPLGYVSIICEDNIADLSISVHKDHQNKGIGSLLMEKIIIFCRGKNIKKIILEVWEHNSAIYLYKKFNFKITGKKEKFYKNGDSKLKMELELY